VRHLCDLNLFLYFLKKSEGENKQNDTATDSINKKNETAAAEEAKESVSITKVPLVIEYIPTGIIPLTDSDKAIAKKR
jgi:hypothetical protein